MGGDRAPEQIVLGGLQAAREFDGEVILVGDPAAIEPLLGPDRPANVRIHPASEIIEMHEKPAEAIRRKRDSSMVVAAGLVKSGDADAFVSAGNTGATAASALLGWGRVKGVDRPAIATQFPNRHGRFLLLDAGASPDADPRQMLEFALMGLAYAERVMGKNKPKAHLLNIGEEPGKGNAFAKEAYELMAKHEWFGGNIESKEMFRKPVDVVVCDAFVGNLVLKACEGVAEYIMGEIKRAVPTGPAKLLWLPLKKGLAPLRQQVDYTEYGGSPLLGVNGVCIIAHGSSDAKAVKNAVLNGARAHEQGLVQAIRDSVEADIDKGIL
ncbi:MAG: phosphate acyltransferase PlsX [Armatimonadetes bacterium]|nr:phosphate acyltransferase PlsX [Armatimonadota bacterium]